jgi:UDP-N-acetylglucosamine 3-dehydrogenase
MKIVQIGMGVWGEKYSKFLSELGVLSGVCDSNLQKSKEYGEKYFVSHYDSIDSLIASENFDGAIVDTNVSSGLEIVTKLLYEKKHVFVENPVIYGSIEGEKLNEISQKKKVVFTGGFDERFNPTTKQVKNFVKEKKYGDLILLEFYSENKLSPQNNKGIIFENSIKDIDIANWLFDEMPLVVFARLGTLNNENEDFASIMLGYKDNKTAIILSNGFSSKKVRKLRAVCSKGVIFSDLISQKIKLEKEDSQVSLGEKEPVLLQIQNFLEVIEGKNELVVKPQESVNVIKIAEAALLSGKQGVPIYLDLK